MKREARVLLSKATDSVLLAIEHFNRLWDRGRHEAVLVFLDRAFELALKSVVVHRGGKIREQGARETLGFDRCINKCESEAKVKCLTPDEACTIRIVNSLRDAAQHYFIDVSEHQLYIYAQSSLTIFDKILRDVFDRKLVDYLPERVLLVSSTPPTDFGSLMDIEFEDIERLVATGSRKRMEARAKLRSFAIVEASLGGSGSQPSENELVNIARRVSRGESWQQIFPGITGLTLTTEGTGFNIMLRITKSKGEPVYLVSEDTPGTTVVAVKRVDELGFYSLNLTSLAEKVRLSMPKTLALVKELNLQEDPDYFKEFAIGSSHFKRYSPKALDRIKRELPNLDMSEIWNKHKPPSRKKTSAV